MIWDYPVPINSQQRSVLRETMIITFQYSYCSFCSFSRPDITSLAASPFRKVQETVADILHPLLGGEWYHFPCLSCRFFCLICVHILQLPVPSLLLMSSTLLSTCCRGRGSEALLVSPYVVCSSPLQPYACTGGRAGYIPPLVPFSAPTCS